MSRAKAIEVLVVDSVAEDIVRNQQQIQRRAYEKFIERGGQHGRDVEDWLSAETELTRIGGINLSQGDRAFMAEVELADVEPEQLELKADTRHILLRNRNSESPQFFWSVEFPAAINPRAVRAEQSEGIAHLIAPFSETGDALDA